MQRQLDSMQTMSRERQHAVFDHHCEHGGKYYNLAFYSPDCHNEMFRGARTCENEPCRVCVSLTDGVCPPTQDKSFVSKLVWHVLIPALIVRFLLLVLSKVVRASTLHGYHGVCRGYHRLPPYRCLAYMSRVFCGHVHLHRVRSSRRFKRLRKATLWLAVFFAVLYGTLLCDKC